MALQHALRTDRQADGQIESGGSGICQPATQLCIGQLSSQAGSWLPTAMDTSLALTKLLPCVGAAGVGCWACCTGPRVWPLATPTSPSSTSTSRPQDPLPSVPQPRSLPGPKPPALALHTQQLPARAPAARHAMPHRETNSVTQAGDAGEIRRVALPWKNWSQPIKTWSVVPHVAPDCLASPSYTLQTGSCQRLMLHAACLTVPPDMAMPRWLETSKNESVAKAAVLGRPVRYLRCSRGGRHGMVGLVMCAVEGADRAGVSASAPAALRCRPGRCSRAAPAGTTQPARSTQ